MGHPAGFEPAASGSANRRSAPLSYGWNLALPAGFEPAISGVRARHPWPLDDGSLTMRERWLPSQESNLPQLCLTGSRVRLARLRGMFGGMSGTRTRRLPLARRRLSLLSYHPELVPRVGFEPPLRAFNAALSPDQLSGRWTGAGGGNRNRVFGVALRGLTFQLRPHGGKRNESNLLPQRDCVYSAATAPAVLIGASRNWRRAEGSNLGPCGPLGFRDRLPATPAALSRRARRARRLVHLPGLEPGPSPL